MPTSSYPKFADIFLVLNVIMNIVMNSSIFSMLFPNSHQVWGLLLTRLVFVLASISGECTVRCPSLFSSWCPGGVPVVSLWCRGGVPGVSAV